jgi:hypothetical protein
MGFLYLVAFASVLRCIGFLCSAGSYRLIGPFEQEHRLSLRGFFDITSLKIIREY